MAWAWTDLGGTILDRPALEPLTQTVVVRGTSNALAFRGLGADRPWRLLSEGATKIAYAPAVCVIGERLLVLCAVQQVRHSPIQQTLGEPWDGRHRTEPPVPSVADPLQGWPVAAPPDPGYAPYGEIRELGGWLCDGPAIAQCTPFHGYQDLVGRGGDNVYYHARGGVTIARDAWRPIPGGVFSSAPSIVHRDPRYVLDTSRVPYDVQYLEVVGRGLDNAVYHATLKGDAWTPWTQIPGLRTQFAPAIASLSWDELYAFAVGLDGRLYSAFRRADGAAWTSWRRYDDGPICTSGPAVARIAERELAVCVRGEAGNVVLGRSVLQPLPRTR